MSDRTRKLLRLISGEEILGVINEVEGKLVIEDAVVLVYQQVDSGRMSVGFAPFMPYVEGPIVMEVTGVAVGYPKEELEREHIRIFSGIEIAGAGSNLKLA